jgi:hypothetical protein
MKRVLSIALVLLSSFVFVVGAAAADREVIKNQVDEIVVALNEGKSPDEFKDAAKKDPYVFIMKQDGEMVVHPSLEGKKLQENAAPVYEELLKATDEGVWVDYEWQGQKKHSYVRKAKGDMIVGSGYNE